MGDKGDTKFKEYLESYIKNEVKPVDPYLKNNVTKFKYKLSTVPFELFQFHSPKAPSPKIISITLKSPTDNKARVRNNLVRQYLMPKHQDEKVYCNIAVFRIYGISRIIFYSRQLDSLKATESCRNNLKALRDGSPAEAAVDGSWYEEMVKTVQCLNKGNANQLLLWQSRFPISLHTPHLDIGLFQRKLTYSAFQRFSIEWVDGQDRTSLLGKLIELAIDIATQESSYMDVIKSFAELRNNVKTEMDKTKKSKEDYETEAKSIKDKLNKRVNTLNNWLRGIFEFEQKTMERKTVWTDFANEIKEYYNYYNPEFKRFLNEQKSANVNDLGLFNRQKGNLIRILNKDFNIVKTEIVRPKDLQVQTTNPTWMIKDKIKESLFSIEELTTTLKEERDTLRQAVKELNTDQEKYSNNVELQVENLNTIANVKFDPIFQSSKLNNTRLKDITKLASEAATTLELNKNLFITYKKKIQNLNMNIKEKEEKLNTQVSNFQDQTTVISNTEQDIDSKFEQLKQKQKTLQEILNTYDIEWLNLLEKINLEDFFTFYQIYLDYYTLKRTELDEDEYKQLFGILFYVYKTRSQRKERPPKIDKIIEQVETEINIKEDQKENLLFHLRRFQRGETWDPEPT